MPDSSLASIKWTRLLLILFCLLSGYVAFSQRIISDDYYKDSKLRKQTSAAQAAFRRQVELLSDGSVKWTLTEMPSGKVLSSEITEYKEPFSTVSQGKMVLDYNFPLVYAPVNTDTLAAIPVGKYGQDNTTIRYQAPKIEGKYPNMGDYLADQIYYPEFARENGISGRVVLQFRLDEAGIPQELAIIGSIHPSLDKEALRVFQKIRFVKPAFLNGIPYKGMISTGVRYTLE